MATPTDLTHERRRVAALKNRPGVESISPPGHSFSSLIAAAG
jgi:hypothetical protein